MVGGKTSSDGLMKQDNNFDDFEVPYETAGRCSMHRDR